MGRAMRQSEERSAVLVIRAWFEPGSDVRARLTQTPDADQPGFEQEAAEGDEAILAAVADWLRSFRAAAER
jgi:hypothetical protein